MPSYGPDSLKTLPEDGIPPACRMADAQATQDWFRRLIDNDSKRSWKRSRLNGLVDGNPPFKMGKLMKAGRADACNVNWGTGRAYLEGAWGAFYDLFSEAPGYITFKTSYGTDEQRERWSNDASAEADIVLKKNNLWDYQIQLSQWDMVLHGCGPLLFEDPFKVLPRAVLCGDLKVPEFTKSDTGYWEAGGCQVTYYPPELYDFIKDEDAATKRGWDVEYTKKVIANAMDIRQQAGIQYEWEFFQQELKNNSLSYYDDSKIIRVAFCVWKEFDGRITIAIVERDSACGTNRNISYLYKSERCYKDFTECVHPMYFDHGNGGYHHSVTGLGVKMYSAMEYENRLICNLCDKAFAPKILFKPTSSEGSQRFELATFGDYGTLPPGYDAVQNPIAGMMQEGIAMKEMLSGVMQNNLSTYRGQVPTQKTGNPVTKFEKQLEAAQQSSLNKTQFNRYYHQLDMLYMEIWRRLCNLNSNDPMAKDFQERCKKKGIPVEALARPEYVGATRVVGQGSSFMRKQAIDSLFPIAGALPEEGRVNLISDKIAAEAGQSAVSRYFPQKKQAMASDQQADAMVWVAVMKTGIPPVMTSDQNPVTYAATFLNAAVQALTSLQKGADPHEVLGFLEICGPAIAAYLQRFGQDPTRTQIHEKMAEQWKQLSKSTDMLKKALAQQHEQQKGQQQRTQQAMTDEQIKSRKAQSDIAIKTAKTKAQLQQSQEKHRVKMIQARQDLAISDAKAASEIHINRLKAFQRNGEGE